jgi:RNA polymerase sigma factor (sigma-70 family)
MSPGHSGGAFQARDVLATVVLHNGAKWVRFAERVLGSRCDAEDVIQESIRRVLVRNRLFLSEEEMRMYLGRTITNTAIEFYHARRRARRRQMALQHQLARVFETDNPHILLEERESYAARAHLMAVLDDALDHLPTKQHEALQLTIFDAKGQSMRRASTVNGIPYSTLRHRSLQGLRRLRKSVQKELRAGLWHLRD